jgi:hypothetical protein
MSQEDYLIEMINEATDMGWKDRLFNLTTVTVRQNPEIPYSEHIRKNLEKIKKENENDTRI